MTKKKILEAIRHKLHYLWGNLNSNDSGFLIGNYGDQRM